MRFETAPAPHLKPIDSVAGVMRDVLLALVPAAFASVYFFGWGLLINVVIASAVAFGCEAAILSLRGKPLRPFLNDYSAIVTAVLLVFALPPVTPWWITATGSFFAIVFAKHLYGGLGYNTFNPAMAGYAVLLIAWPAELSQWLPPRGLGLDLAELNIPQTLTVVFTGQLPQELSWDFVSAATPLDTVKTGLAEMKMMSEIESDPIFGRLGGVGWGWVNAGFLAGGIYLLARGVIRWHIPVAMLTALFAIASVFYMADSSSHATPTLHLFGGATLIGAFFIATDPVSAATSVKGRLVYAAGIGLLVYAIRSWSSYPDGVAFAVLLMNMAVPLIDHFTKPRTYGHAQP